MVHHSALRITAAIIAGIFVGFFLFFVVALVLGLFSETTGFSVSTNFSENAFSAVLLAGLILLCSGAFVWKVWTSPTVEETGKTEEIEE
jgi:predicted transporter